MVRKMWMFVAVMLFAAAVLAPFSSAQEKPVVRSTWGALKALYRGAMENPTAVAGTDSVMIGTLIVKSRASTLSSRTVWSRVANINLNETLYMVVPRGSNSAVYFLPCKAGNWRLTYRQCYQLGDPGYINMYYAYTPGCMCTSTTSWAKMTTMTAFTWKRSQTFWCTNGNYGFRFDLFYPNCYYPCSGTDGDAIFELTITNA